MFTWTDSPSGIVEIGRMSMQPPRHDPRQMSLRMRALRSALSPEIGAKTQAEFAHWLGIGPTTWGNYEKQGLRPGIDEASKIAGRTGASLDWIYHGETRGLTRHLAQQLDQAMAALSPERQA